jgi:hypothetical protein
MLASWKLWAIGAAILAVIFGLGWTAIKVFPASLIDAGAKIKELERKNELAESKIAAYMRAQERRDAAIKASPCKGQIEFWIKNPDNLPGTWNPHEQLTAPNIRDNPKPGGGISLPSWSQLNPLNWW